MAKKNSRADELNKELVRAQKALDKKRSELGREIARGGDPVTMSVEITQLETRVAAIQAGIIALADSAKAEVQESKAAEVEKVRLNVIREKLEGGRWEAYKRAMALIEQIDANLELESELGLHGYGRIPGFFPDTIRLLKFETKRIYGQTPETLGGKHHPSSNEQKRVEIEENKKRAENFLAERKKAGKSISKNSDDTRVIDAINTIERAKKELAELK